MNPCMFGLPERRRRPRPKRHSDDPRVLEEFTLEAIADRIKEGKAKNIIVLTGAGISVAAGIPDFRSPGTGLYAQLQKYDLREPECVFSVDYFRCNPEPFYVLCREHLKETYYPTKAHLFIKLLEQKGLLLRNYTQNVDMLERRCELDLDRLVECHGTYATAHTMKRGGRRKEVPIEVFKERLITRGENCICDEETGSLIRPDVVLFGENLPVRYFLLKKVDFKKCDLLIVMGTSLKVEPVASLPRPCSGLSRLCPRLLLNNELAGDFLSPDDKDNKRDVCVFGNLQDSVSHLVELLGWQTEFAELQTRFAPPSPPASSSATICDSPSSSSFPNLETWIPLKPQSRASLPTEPTPTANIGTLASTQPSTCSTTSSSAVILPEPMIARNDGILAPLLEANSIPHHQQQQQQLEQAFAA